MKSIKCLLLIISMMSVLSAVAQVETKTFYEPELLMISQPKMEFYTADDDDFVQFYFDVKNIGSETYKGEFIILMEPDVDHFYAKKKIKVKAGAVKRVKVELDLGMIYYDSVYTVLPVYDFENQWYPLTAYEQFSSLMLCLNSPSYSQDLIVTAEPAPVVDYYYDMRLQRPPVYGYYYVTPPPGWAYAYGYNPYYVNNYYTVINGNVNDYNGGNNHVVNINERPSAPKVSHNHYSTSVSNTSSSSRRSHSVSGNSVTPSVPRRTTSGTSSSARTSSSSSDRRSSSVSNPSNPRNNSSSTSSSSRRSSSSSSTISNSSSSRSSSSRSSSSKSSSSSSSRSSSSSNSRSGGGRR
ncbi:MAG: hypothetical protein KBT67_04685 [bacterium]|nr:hypothetical protein [Candidatus Limimorpha caballi]